MSRRRDRRRRQRRRMRRQMYGGDVTVAQPFCGIGITAVVVIVVVWLTMWITLLSVGLTVPGICILVFGGLITLGFGSCLFIAYRNYKAIELTIQNVNEAATAPSAPEDVFTLGPVSAAVPDVPPSYKECIGVPPPYSLAQDPQVPPSTLAQDPQAPPSTLAQDPQAPPYTLAQDPQVPPYTLAQDHQTPPYNETVLRVHALPRLEAPGIGFYVDPYAVSQGNGYVGPHGNTHGNGYTSPQGNSYNNGYTGPHEKGHGNGYVGPHGNNHGNGYAGPQGNSHGNGYTSPQGNICNNGYTGPQGIEYAYSHAKNHDNNPVAPHVYNVDANNTYDATSANEHLQQSADPDTINPQSPENGKT
ncbi:pre-mRNA 3' end processing protein WDR33-like [Penaeus japonicus]|uniref:pre-mRNA 3' end processing protein WDR33-like n=1 Tax=Penaeus japonicus TaxID=27405 RepID=UPI001C70BD01|nr:pre-mRNA 3' end processing protein WDR33-like [Penaeus japonicus]XP_042863619.1 pre-mRNA 3' end processing protein WDR33-like [Penaeus japonicus]